VPGLDAGAADRWRQLGGVEITWDFRLLAAFNDQPVSELGRSFDLIVIDHPFVGTAASTRCLASLDELLPPETLGSLAADSMGASHASYRYAGCQSVLATDAACQVAVVRDDLLPVRPESWDDVLAFVRRRPARAALPVRLHELFAPGRPRPPAALRRPADGGLRPWRRGPRGLRDVGRSHRRGAVRGVSHGRRNPAARRAAGGGATRQSHRLGRPGCGRVRRRLLQRDARDDRDRARAADRAVVALVPGAGGRATRTCATALGGRRSCASSLRCARPCSTGRDPWNRLAQWLGHLRSRGSAFSTSRK
jgi:hypothetical protein